MSEQLQKTASTELQLKLEFVKEIPLATAVLALDRSGDSQSVFVSCLDGGIYQVELQSGTIQQVGQHQSYAAGIQCLRKSGRVISSGYDGVLTWYEGAPLERKRQVQAHQFWSWQLHASSDERWVASSTGQYLAGGYKYEPAPEKEPSIQLFDAASGELKTSFSHLPPVQCVAFSPDSRFLAAGNMMGEVKVWDVESGKQVSQWSTPSFTSWGIIKSHHYIGGIFDLCFSPDSREVYVCGMGPMGDPMAGNGKQRWERFSRDDGKKLGQTQDSETGNGLMEVITFHPQWKFFAMAGRLAQGNWNAAFFGSDSGNLIGSVDTKMRNTDLVFLPDGQTVVFSGATGQEKKKDGRYPLFGRIKVYRFTRA